MPILRPAKSNNRPNWVGFLLYSKPIIILEYNTLYTSIPLDCSEYSLNISQLSGLGNVRDNSILSAWLAEAD